MRCPKRVDFVEIIQSKMQPIWQFAPDLNKEYIYILENGSNVMFLKPRHGKCLGRVSTATCLDDIHPIF